MYTEVLRISSSAIWFCRSAWVWWLSVPQLIHLFAGEDGT